MEYRQFGNTDLKVSAVGFGAWGIGGSAMAGDLPIGWGRTDDRSSIDALEHAYEHGITFYDTADFYGLGHSEELIGKVLSKRPDVIIATKVGHRLGRQGEIHTDYSGAYIREACEQSLRRLRRETIDYYQLHTAKVKDLQSGDCVETMEQLATEGKVRHWGVSLNTFHPEPEGEYLLAQPAGSGVQIVLNILNQQVVPLMKKLAAAGYGIIARMPLQFGLLTGKFDAHARFDRDDHRSFRLSPEVLREALSHLEPVWPLCEKYAISKTGLALSFILGFQEVSTVIPGIKTPQQVYANTKDIVSLDLGDHRFLQQLFAEQFQANLMPVLKRSG